MSNGIFEHIKNANNHNVEEVEIYAYIKTKETHMDITTPGEGNVININAIHFKAVTKCNEIDKDENKLNTQTKRNILLKNKCDRYHHNDEKKMKIKKKTIIIQKFYIKRIKI